MIGILVNLDTVLSNVQPSNFWFKTFIFFFFFSFLCSCVPPKLMMDWKELFLNGKPIYEQASIQPLPDEPSPEQFVELNKMSLLDEKDYGEYKVHQTDKA